MKNKLIQIIKKIPILYNIIRLIKYTPVNTKKLLKKANYHFIDLPASLELFNNTPPLPHLIISLTSFPARLKYIEYTLYSLIKQSIRPEKIILCLSEKEFPNKEIDIPENIKRYYPFGLEVQFEKENYKSYKKLVYTLAKYPEHVIVTADDDVFYKKNWLKILYTTHKLFSNDIISHKIRRISFTNKQINSYLSWKNFPSNASYLNCMIGYGGVLYPPNSLHKDATNVSLFSAKCPNADDIWFYVMALLANTKIRKPKSITKSILSFDYTYKDEYNNVPKLTDINWENNMNDIQLKTTLEHYNIYDNFYEFVKNKELICKQ